MTFSTSKLEISSCRTSVIKNGFIWGMVFRPSWFFTKKYLPNTNIIRITEKVHYLYLARLFKPSYPGQNLATWFQPLKPFLSKLLHNFGWIPTTMCSSPHTTFLMHLHKYPDSRSHWHRTLDLWRTPSIRGKSTLLNKYFHLWSLVRRTDRRRRATLAGRNVILTIN